MLQRKPFIGEQCKAVSIQKEKEGRIENVLELICCKKPIIVEQHKAVSIQRKKVGRVENVLELILQRKCIVVESPKAVSNAWIPFWMFYFVSQNEPTLPSLTISINGCDK